MCLSLSSSAMAFMSINDFFSITLKIIFQDTRIFEMMILADDLGVEELKTACEDYVTSTLSVANACTLLAAVLQAQEKSPGKQMHFFS